MHPTPIIQFLLVTMIVDCDIYAAMKLGQWGNLSMPACVKSKLYSAQRKKKIIQLNVLKEKKIKPHRWMEGIWKRGEKQNNPNQKQIFSFFDR